MGVTCGFRRVSDEQIERMIADPQTVEAIMEPSPAFAAEWQAWLRKMDDASGSAEAHPEPPCDPARMDIDKAWHGIHYLLTGDPYEGAPPLNFICAGGETIGDPSGEVGPMRALRRAEVQEIHNALSAVTAETLAARFDPHALDAADIYPSMIWVRDGKDALEYLTHYFNALKVFIAETAKRGEGMVIEMG